MVVLYDFAAELTGLKEGKKNHTGIGGLFKRSCITRSGMVRPKLMVFKLGNIYSLILRISSNRAIISILLTGIAFLSGPGSVFWVALGAVFVMSVGI